MKYSQETREVSGKGLVENAYFSTAIMPIKRSRIIRRVTSGLLGDTRHHQGKPPLWV
ncbi:hypothetical protein [Nostoc sp.]|uniref:hypothetical protein n=1 Tax=Nostoc sp. TaxID=1180 RepID=UPI002FF78F1E